MKDYKTEEFRWDTEGYPKTPDNTQNQYIEGAEEDAPSELSEDRPSKKKKKKRKRKKKRYMLKFLIVVLICVGIYCFLHSSLFNIKEIKTPESTHFTAAQMSEMAGIKTGMNLFDFSGSKSEDKLKENPYIKDAKVKRSLPTTVEIQLNERQEAAIIPKDKEFILIDNEGVVLGTVKKDPQLTVLAALTVTKAEEGGAVQVKEKDVFEKSMKILHTMQKSDLYFKRIDASQLLVKVYITDTLLCRGKPKNLIISMEEKDLQTILKDLIYKKKIKKGVVNIGDDKYYSFNKKIK